MTPIRWTTTVTARTFPARSPPSATTGSASRASTGARRSSRSSSCAPRAAATRPTRSPRSCTRSACTCACSTTRGGEDPTRGALRRGRLGERGGILFVAAAGNSGLDNDAMPQYPSSLDLPNVIAVAATDRDDQLASFSNWGATSVDVAAPGVDIYSTWPGGAYRLLSGTSMACHSSPVRARSCSGVIPG
ncbi:MAG: S8 family serine peptidase [Candidatus Eisenbacteria bacterium]|nr:S8 family serine peptidase [Candidatus Eisenbacteria bacterium]